MSDEYEVERIEGRRYSKGKGVQYLVRWKDYSKTDNTWEAKSNIMDTSLIRNFINKYKMENNGESLPIYGTSYIEGAYDVDEVQKTLRKRTPRKRKKTIKTTPTVSPKTSGTKSGITLATKSKKPRTPIIIADTSSETSTPECVEIESIESSTVNETETLVDLSNIERPNKKARSTNHAIIPVIDYPAVPGRNSIRDVIETDEELKFIQKSLQDSNTDALKQKHPLVNDGYGRKKFKDINPPVYVVNDHDETLFPEIFVYVDDLIINSKVTPPDPDFLVGCDCDKVCLHIRNASFCHEDSAYTNKGFLNNNHTGAIYECNSACKCDPEKCPNRVVQRGRQVPLELFKTTKKGWGVRTLRPIKKNTFVEEYLGEVITEEEGSLRGKIYDRIGLSYLFDMDLAGVDGYQEFVIDSYVCGNSSHFFNHSCEPNLLVYGVFYDSMDVRFHRLAFFANRDIDANEELTFDYTGISHDDDDDTLSKKFPCHCGADTCRHWIHL